MVTQISGNTVNKAQMGVVTSGELKKMAAGQQGQNQPEPVDTVQISQSTKEELPITEREMKLLNAIRRKEFFQAFTSSKGIGVDGKLTVGLGCGSLASMISSIVVSSMGASPLVTIGAAAVTFGLVYAGSSAVQGARNAHQAEKEWGGTFISSSEKDSLRRVMEEYPQIGYRYQV